MAFTEYRVLEGLRKQTARAVNQLQRMLGNDLSIIPMTGGRLSIGGSKYEVSSDFESRHSKLLDRLLDLSPSSPLSPKERKLFYNLSVLLKGHPEAKKSLDRAIQKMEQLLPKDPKGLVAQFDHFIVEMGQQDDPEIQRQRKVVEDNLRNGELLWLLQNLVKIGSRAKKIQRPQQEIQWCPGSWTSVTVSHANIARGSVHCPQCGKPIGIRGFKNNEDYVRTLPRHRP